MNDWSPKSWWERLRRTVEGWMDEDMEADDGSMLFHFLFVAPLLIAFLFLIRR